MRRCKHWMIQCTLQRLYRYVAIANEAAEDQPDDMMSHQMDFLRRTNSCQALVNQQIEVKKRRLPEDLT